MVSSSHSNPIEIQCLIVKTCVSMFFHVFPTIFLCSARHLWCWLKCWRWVKPGALDAGPPGNPRGLQLCHFNCWSSCGLKKNFSSCDMFSTCSVIVQVWKPSSLEYVPNCQVILGHFRGLPWCSILLSYPALHPSTLHLLPGCLHLMSTGVQRELPWMGQNWVTSELDS